MVVSPMAALKNLLKKIFMRKPLELLGRLNIDPTSSVNIRRVVLKKDCTLTIERDSQIEGAIVCERDSVHIRIGKRTFMNGTLIAAQGITIGDDVLMSWGVTVVDHNSHSISFSERSRDVQEWRVGKKDWSNVKIIPVQVSNKVWIGFNVIILKGVTIGEGSVVGAGSVVTKDVPPWTVVAGNPARVIRAIPEDER
jgi:acetyltransferase-like isoleucine patch superfamily enzyme